MPGPGKAELCFTDEDGRETRETIMDFGGSGIVFGTQPVVGGAHTCELRLQSLHS